MFRSPAVAGRFYPDEAFQLRHDLSGFLGTPSPQPALGIVSPHAGYIFSGRIAGETFARVEVTDTVIVLGPNHYGNGSPLALWEGEGWLTPLGEIQVDHTMARLLLESMPEIKADPSAHRQEHSLEVQVPFIQMLNPSARILPLMIGMTPLSVLQQLGRTLAMIIQQLGKPTLIVASSDMTHFENSEAAARKDHLALEHVHALDPEGLFRTVRDHRISMCGVLPVVVMLYAAIELGASSSTLVDYATSGDVTGDYNDVVAYAGAIIA